MFGFAVHFHFHGDVAVGGLDDLVGYAFDFLRHFVEFAAHEAFDGIDGVARVGDGLALGRLADEPLAALGERDDGRRGALALGISKTDGSPPSMTAMQELVVPKSMPKTFAIKSFVYNEPLTIQASTGSHEFRKLWN